MGLILIGIAVIVIIFGVVSIQRGLVRADELCGNALSQIGVQQTSRWDALTSLAKLTRDYSAHEYDTMMAVIGKRKAINSSSSPEEVTAQEDLMAQVTGRLVALAEAYPDLKANTLYLSMMNSVDNYENKVRISRMSYNDTVTNYNRMVRQFPSGIFAGMFGFQKRNYLESDSAKSGMPVV
ncbi:MAG: LemA family protein [Clostridiaceae bacterium]|nr:LemA family protein [Clostridiaceae bacterium]